jgi:hypothetical protein
MPHLADTRDIDALLRDRLIQSGHLPPGRTVTHAVALIGTTWIDPNTGAVRYETVIVYPAGPPTKYWLRGALRRLQARLRYAR